MSNEEADKSKASFFYTLKGVLWALIGVRRGAGYEEDVQRIKPAQAIIIGIIAVVVFILVLALVVSTVIGKVSGS